MVVDAVSMRKGAHQTSHAPADMAPTPVDIQTPGVPNFLDEVIYVSFGGGFGPRQSANVFLVVGAVVVLL